MSPVNHTDQSHHTKSKIQEIKNFYLKSMKVILAAYNFCYLMYERILRRFLSLYKLSNICRSDDKKRVKKALLKMRLMSRFCILNPHVMGAFCPNSDKLMYVHKSSHLD